MNTASKLFFENFVAIAASDGGVAKLRELILQLAVQGKLVPQDSKDEPASELLKKIEHKQPANNKAIDRRDENSYCLPRSWEWTTLSRVGEINPRNNASDELQVSFVPMALIPSAYGQTVKSETRNWKEIKQGFTHFAENDVAVAKITPCFQNGKSTVMKGLKNAFGAGTTELHVFRPYDGTVLPQYVLVYVKSPDFLKNGESQMTGSAGQKRVPKCYFAENPFPLPPIAEQKRIVAKVDELMALCNQLERQLDQARQRHLQLNDSALHHLLQAENAKYCEKTWKLICEQFHILYDSPENVEKLRQAIFQLAVQGKLVPQDPNDEPAYNLLKKIQDEKDKLVKLKILKKGKAVSGAHNKDNVFDLPKGWAWGQIDDIGALIDNAIVDGPFGSNLLLSDYDPKGAYPVLKISYLDNGFDINEMRKINESKFSELKRSAVHPGDILVAKIGSSYGKSGIYPQELPVGMIPANLLKITLHDSFIKSYIMAFLKSPFFWEQLNHIVKFTAQPAYNVTAFKALTIPIPPLAEQKRIVAKVDKLMALCDELEDKIRRTRLQTKQLTESIIHHLLAG